MFHLVVLSTFAALCTAAAPGVVPVLPILDGRIVGGESAEINEFPYQLSLLKYESHLCGASIISQTRALTAAHCTAGVYASILTIRAGSINRDSGGVIIPVRRIAIHPYYHDKTTDYDVSVLILAYPLVWGPSIQPIALQEVGQEVAEGTLATVTGWGRLSAGGSIPSVLQKVEVPQVSEAACKSAYQNYSMTARMTCYGYIDEGGKDSCQGDSGGPLVANGRIVGVVSWGKGCASPGLPGVYAKIANQELHSYILNAMQ